MNNCTFVGVYFNDNDYIMKNVIIIQGKKKGGRTTIMRKLADLLQMENVKTKKLDKGEMSIVGDYRGTKVGMLTFGDMKRFLAAVLLLAACWQSVMSQTFKVGNIYYKVIGSQSVEVTTGNYIEQNITSLTIPEEVTYNDVVYKVTGIGESAFYRCGSLESISFPDGLTSIGDVAFYGCGSLRSVELTASLRNIGWDAFCNCDNLTTVTVGDGAPVTDINPLDSIGYRAFAYCDKLKSVTLPDGISRICPHAFAGCGSLESISLPDGLTSIGDVAFSGCSSLGSVVIPGGVGTVGVNAFYRSGVRTLVLEDGVRGVDANAFSECMNLESVELPPSLRNIGGTAFWNCDNLTTVTVGDGAPVTDINPLDSIGQSAFEYCDKLKSVTLPDGISRICPEAFAGCVSLESISLPGSLTDIGESAFSGCSSLGSVVIPGGVGTVGVYAFYRSGVRTLVLEDGVRGVDASAFYECMNLESVELPASLRNIGWDAFWNCDNLTTVTVGDGAPVTDINPLDSIGYRAFAYCDKLKSVTLPDGISRMCPDAFAGCVSLESISLPGSLTDIGESAFSGCGSLESISLPDGLTSIGDAAFYGCGSLEKIILPKGLKNIGNIAFNYDVEVLLLSSEWPEVTGTCSADVFSFIPTAPGQGWNNVHQLCLSSVYDGESPKLQIEGDTLQYYDLELDISSVDLSNEYGVGKYEIDGFNYWISERGSDDEKLYTSYDGTLTYSIEKAPLTVSVSPLFVPITYGEARPDFKVTYDGFVNGENESELSSLPVLDGCPVSYYPVVGDYPITVSGGSARNYYFEYADGELTVGKAELTVTGKSYTVAYGDELPDFGYDIEGFVLGDDEGDLSALPSVSPLSDPDAGSYTLSITGGEADNYRFDYHPGTLTVLKAAQTIDWSQDFTSGLSQGDMVEITATATSGLGITYESTNDDVAEVIHIDGRPYLSCVNDGSANIIATQPGDGNHEAAPSVTRRVNVGHGSGLALSASSPSVGCRPSPARDVLEVTGTDASMTAAVYSPSGAMVLSSRCADGMTRLDVSRLDAGTYILVVSGGDGATARLRFAKE